MSDKKVRWGILGTSPISGVLAKAIQASTSSELVAIGSRTNSAAAEFAEQFSLPKYYDSHQALIHDDEIDAVYIGLPNHLHKAFILACAEAGKHILCEKPFVISETEMHQVMHAVQRAHVFCMEALMYRSHPFTHKLKEIVDSGVLGHIKLFSALYTADIAAVANNTAGGAIRNLGCYPVSLIRLLAGAEPVSVQSIGRWNDETNTDNQASAMLRFADDAMAVVSTADDIAMRWEFTVYGENGSLRAISNPWMPHEECQCVITLGKHDETLVTVKADKPLYTYQIDLMNHHILQHNWQLHDGISLQDSMGNVAVLEAWRQQVREQHAAQRHRNMTLLDQVTNL